MKEEHVFYLLVGVLTIVSIFVLLSQTDTNLAGSAFENTQNTCEPTRYCDGSRVVLLQEDCSYNYAYCQAGCRDGLCL